eukprot:g3323.t1
MVHASGDSKKQCNVTEIKSYKCQGLKGAGVTWNLDLDGPGDAQSATAEVLDTGAIEFKWNFPNGGLALENAIAMEGGKADKSKYDGFCISYESSIPFNIEARPGPDECAHGGQWYNHNMPASKKGDVTKIFVKWSDFKWKGYWCESGDINQCEGNNLIMGNPPDLTCNYDVRKWTIEKVAANLNLLNIRTCQKDPDPDCSNSGQMKFHSFQFGSSCDANTPAPTHPKTPKPTDPKTPKPTDPKTPKPTHPKTPKPTHPKTPKPTHPKTPKPTHPKTPKPTKPGTTKTPKPTKPGTTKTPSPSPSLTTVSPSPTNTPTPHPSATCVQEKNHCSALDCCDGLKCSGNGYCVKSGGQKLMITSAIAFGVSIVAFGLL